MAGSRLHTDIAIIGGGIAGLWALELLRARGYGALLFEREALGSGQTIGAQGMLHGGLKYALGGVWSGGSETIAAMPGRWQASLAGTATPDLRGVRVLSDGLWLWSDAGLPSRLAALLAGRILRGRVERVAPADFPPPLASDRFRGAVLHVDDPVLDIPSLLETLAQGQRDALLRIDWREARLRRDGGSAVLDLPGCTVVPRRLLLCAGAGNEALLVDLGAPGPAMQRRPLQQVIFRHRYAEPFYGHCLGAGSTPRLTVSSHRDRSGRPVWYLGGDLATAGADEEPCRLIERAQAELAALFPWLDFGPGDWRTVRLERAEPRQRGGRRPDRPFLEAVPGLDNTLVAWPTKLTLAPALGDALLATLAAAGIAPRERPDPAALATLTRPRVAPCYWDTLFP